MTRSTLSRMAAAGTLALALFATACDDTNEPELQNIPETAASAGSFTTLLAAVEAAGLATTLANEGPFTVFAPTDEAFAALPAGTVESLLADPDALASILLYHVIAGEVLAADVVSLTSATTLQGSSVSIDASSGVKINDANVIQTDVLASNGVIHVIDKVLLPPQ
jgi:uncharacterized surface protein with fasciclin (FAS1) repeats